MRLEITHECVVEREDRTISLVYNELSLSYCLYAINAIKLKWSESEIDEKNTEKAKNTLASINLLEEKITSYSLLAGRSVSVCLDSYRLCLFLRFRKLPLTLFLTPL